MTTAVVGIDLAKRRFVAWSGGSTSTARSCERLIRWLVAQDVRLFEVQPVHTKRAKQVA